MNRVGGLVELSGRNPRVRGISYGSRGRQLMQSTVVSRDMSCDYLPHTGPSLRWLLQQAVLSPVSLMLWMTIMELFGRSTSGYSRYIHTTPYPYEYPFRRGASTGNEFILVHEYALRKGVNIWSRTKEFTVPSLSIININMFCYGMSQTGLCVVFFSRIRVKRVHY